MVGREIGNRNAGSVRAAINMFGERINFGDSPVPDRNQMSLPEGSSSRAKELLLVRKDVDQYDERRRAADSVKARAEAELSEAKKTVKNLRLLIEESSSKAESKNRDSAKLRRPARREERSAVTRGSERYPYEEVAREVEIIKQEVSKLKLGVASVLEEKSQAEKEAEASRSMVASYSSSAEALREEIEEVNEEVVLVELARIEALKELGEIEAQREKDASEHVAALDETQRKIKEVNDEIDKSKEIEAKLAVTRSDIEVLQVGLSLARDMQKRTNNSAEEDRSEDSRLFRSVKKELKKAKKELSLLTDEAFESMSSMDVIRTKLRHVVEETARLKKNEEKVDSTVQTLDSKMLRAKSKLEAVSAAAEKVNMVASNLGATLEKLRIECEAERKEKELVEDETVKIKAETEETERRIDVAEEKLQAAVQELEEAKTSEALALEKLGTHIERTARDRASASKNSSHITISKFEYDYLMGQATWAGEIADKKVAAAQAWIEALKANEREVLLKSRLANREVREMRVQEEEQQVFRTERTLSAKNKVEGEINVWRTRRDTDTETEYLPLTFPKKASRKAGGEKSYPSPATGFRVRKSGSPASRLTGRSSSITLKRKKKVIPNISKFFGGKNLRSISLSNRRKTVDLFHSHIEKPDLPDNVNSGGFPMYESSIFL